MSAVQEFTRWALAVELPSTHAIGRHAIGRVLVELAQYADAEGVTYPGRSTIANDVSAINERDARNAIFALLEAGLISFAEPPKRGRPTRYRLNVEPVPSATITTEKAGYPANSSMAGYPANAGTEVGGQVGGQVGGRVGGVSRHEEKGSEVKRSTYGASRTLRTDNAIAPASTRKGAPTRTPSGDGNTGDALARDYARISGDTPNPEGVLGSPRQHRERVELLVASGVPARITSDTVAALETDEGRALAAKFDIRPHVVRPEPEAEPAPQLALVPVEPESVDAEPEALAIAEPEPINECDECRFCGDSLVAVPNRRACHCSRLDCRQLAREVAA